MKREQILQVFKNLAQSQGSYGRLLRDLEEDSEYKEKYLDFLEKQNFKDSLDLIMFVEG